MKLAVRASFVFLILFISSAAQAQKSEAGTDMRNTIRRVSYAVGADKATSDALEKKASLQNAEFTPLRPGSVARSNGALTDTRIAKYGYNFVEKKNETGFQSLSLRGGVGGSSTEDSDNSSKSAADDTRAGLELTIRW
jgi:hypothetical protein